MVPLIAVLAFGLGAIESPSVAFYYGTHLPTEPLAHYDEVVVEPSNVTDTELHALQEADTRVFAYVSVGEVLRSRE